MLHITSFQAQGVVVEAVFLLRLTRNYYTWSVFLPGEFLFQLPTAL